MSHKPTAANCKRLAIAILRALDLDNGESWGDDSACPYPTQLVAIGAGIVKAALLAGWQPTETDLDDIAGGTDEEGNMHPAIKAVPGTYNGGPASEALHAWVDWAFDGCPQRDDCEGRNLRAEFAEFYEAH